MVNPIIEDKRPLRLVHEGEEVARRYVDGRFESQLNNLLHDRQVAVLNSLFEEHRPAMTLEIAPGPGRLTRDVSIDRFSTTRHSSGSDGPISS